MTPIEKNIRVVDAQGNELEATYPRRAKGLVKNGRARFIDENTICLACPPKIMEDITMSENIITENVEQTVTKNAELTAKEVFLKIAEIQKYIMDTENSSLEQLSKAIQSLADMGLADTEAVEQICSIHEQREASIQTILGIYGKMYQDIQCKDARNE